MQPITIVQLVLAFLLIHACFYASLNRICKCFENCASARAAADVLLKKSEVNNDGNNPLQSSEGSNP